MQHVNIIVRWLLFTVIISFMPFAAMFVVSRYFEYQSDGMYVAEILFACIFISAETIRTLIEIKDAKWQGLQDVLLLVAIITLVFPAILYGGMLLGHDGELHILAIPVVLLYASFISGFVAMLYKKEVK